MERINISENGLNLVFEITDKQEFKLLHFCAAELDEDTLGSYGKETIDYMMFVNQAFSFLELNLTGFDRVGERHGNKHIMTSPGFRLTYKGMTDTRNDLGRCLVITLEDKPTGIKTQTSIQFYDGASIARFVTTVKNSGNEPQGLEHISSFHLSGIEKEGKLHQDDKLRVLVPHSSWYRETNWQSFTLPKLGLALTMEKETQHSSKAFKVTNVGNWSAKEYLPMAIIQNEEINSSLFFQIEHNGSWSWEISEDAGHLYLDVAGPSELEHHWYKTLKPGESFETVPVAVGSVLGGIDRAVGELTKYRRKIRRKNQDNQKLPVIFNDYMNCLWANPTEEAELPLIDAAAEIGCEYFCIDAGWYADGYWWDSVGEWRETAWRFPHGLKYVTDYIRQKGMTPGIWIEIEVMGINCPLADKLPDDWFFCRHGKKVRERSRYQLDFRNPDVRKYADDTIDRLISDYGIGYFKIDYNIEPGIGTDLNADSPGDGLLEHERAYLGWLDEVFKRHPDLVIENCSSGGMRMDYALLSRLSVQSTSDQADYKFNCTIAANAPSALTPEQAAVWSYPLASGDNEEVVFNMINSLLLRIHQSGQILNLTDERRALIAEGIADYKSIRQDIKQSLPFWPLGFADFKKDFLSLGLLSSSVAYIAVWRREGEKSKITLPLEFKAKSVECIYPSYNEWKYRLCGEGLEAELKKPYSARLFKLEL